MKHIGQMHCKQCGHTFELRYDGFYDTHHCGGHESTKHINGCRQCRKEQPPYDVFTSADADDLADLKRVLT